jgi:hypothetical protein
MILFVNLQPEKRLFFTFLKYILIEAQLLPA